MRWKSGSLISSIASAGAAPKIAWRGRCGGWRAKLNLNITLLNFALQPPQHPRHAIFGAAPAEAIDEISDPDFHRTHEQLYLASAIDLHAAEKTAIGRDPANFVYRDTFAHDWCANNYGWFDRRIVHKFGLTDPILARVQVRSHRPGHKYGLFPLAEDLTSLFSQLDPGRGMMRTAVERGLAPKWIAHNLDTIELVERKTFNNHIS